MQSGPSLAIARFVVDGKVPREIRHCADHTLSGSKNQGCLSNQVFLGYISVVLSDFGISLKLVDNRLQQLYNTSTAADVFILDPAYAGLSYMGGYRNDVLGKTGHSDMRLLSTHWMTKVFREDAHALIADIDPTAAVTA